MKYCHECCTDCCLSCYFRSCVTKDGHERSHCCCARRQVEGGALFFHCQVPVCDRYERRQVNIAVPLCLAVRSFRLVGLVVLLVVGLD